MKIKWSDAQVATKIAFSFLAPLLLVVLMSVWAYRASLFVSAHSERIRDERLVLANTSHQMEKDVIQIQQWLTDISATRGWDGLDDGYAEAEASYQSFVHGLAQFEAVYQRNADEDGLAVTRELARRADAYYAMGKKMADAYIRDGTHSGNRTMGEFDEAAKQLAESLQPFILEHTNAMEQEVVAMDDAVRSLMHALLYVFGVIILSVIVSGVVLVRAIVPPLSRSLTFVRELEAGRLTGRLRIDSNDEIGVLMRALQSMNDRMRQIVGEVRIVAQNVAHASSEIVMGNTDLSQRTEEQASSLEETTAGMEEMTVTVKQNADNARLASELAVNAVQQAGNGGVVISKAVGAMAEVSNASERIVDIIGLVDGIAFQTNLLALNAAVEAARAGEQGRGFAVVATEVRELARRSATAASEIKQLINDSLDKVRTGTDLVDAAGTSLQEIVAGVEKLSTFLSDIATGSREQALGVEQMSQAIMQMDETTRQNAALVEESTSASAMLRDQAERLTKLMEFFDLDDERAATVSRATALAAAGGLAAA